MLLSRAKMLSMFNKGHIDEIVKELRLYGTITADNRWDESDNGSFRAMTIDHRGIVWDVLLNNGNIKELGYTIV